jgi:hypothetical protein
MRMVWTSSMIYRMMSHCSYQKEELPTHTQHFMRIGLA